MLDEKKQVLQLINQSSDVLIVFPKNYTPDHLGSALAVASFLQNQRKSVDLACESFTAQELAFLLQDTEIMPQVKIARNFVVTLDSSNVKITNLRYERRDNLFDVIIETQDGTLKEDDVSITKSNFNYDLIITIGASGFEHLGNIFQDNVDFFYGMPIINIDNKANNENFGQINLVDINYSSLAELIFVLFNNDKNTWSSAAATALLTGIITATNNFKSITATPQTFKTAARLIEEEADRSLIMKNLFHTHTVSSLRLFGRALARSQNTDDKQIFYTALRVEDFEKTDTNLSNVPKLMSELVTQIPRVPIILLFCEEANEKTQIFAFSRQIDLISALNPFEPQGDKYNARMTLESNITTTEDKIINRLRDFSTKRD